MNSTMAVSLGLAVCLSCTVALASDSELAMGAGHPESEEASDESIQKSYDYYNAGDFERSLQTAEEAARLATWQSAVAYNNICTAQLQLGEYAKAERACKKALELAPEFERAQNNLAWVFQTVVDYTPTVGAYLDLSMGRYWQDRLDDSVAAARQALEIDPTNAIAHNNICAAFAKGGKAKAAIRECELALATDPDYQLAKNNLEWARSQLTD